MFYTEDLENTIEELVFMNLKNIIEEDIINFCKCQICIQDIAAIVLNKVPPKYKINIIDKFSLTEKEKDELDKLSVIIREALITAIEIVENSPHH